MKPYTCYRALLAGAAYTLQGCQDSPIEPSKPASKLAVQPNIAADTSEAAIRPRYSITINAIGPVKLGEAIRLRAQIRSYGAVADAEIAIALPELAVVTGDTMTSAKKGMGPEVRRAVVQRQSFSDASSSVLTTDILVRAPGIYRAVATVKTLSEEPRLPNTPLVQESARDELWLIIDSTGGHVLRRANESSVPRGWATVPGPRRTRKPGGVSSFVIPCGDPGADPSCNPGGGGPGGTYTLTTQWYSSDINSYLPLKQAAYVASDGTNSYSGVTRRVRSALSSVLLRGLYDNAGLSDA